MECDHERGDHTLPSQFPIWGLLEEKVAGCWQVDEEAHVLVRGDAKHPELAKGKALTVVHSLDWKEIEMGVPEMGRLDCKKGLCRVTC